MAMMRKKPRLKKQSWSGELVGNNEDLITQILLNLPVSSLVRFKSVSKSWHSIITDLKFERNHYLRNGNSSPVPHSLFFYHCHFKSPETELMLSLSGHTGRRKRRLKKYSVSNGIGLFQMVQSCYGLQLLRVGSRTEECYYVHNWTTGRFEKIPCTRNELAFFYYLVFELLRSLNYKIVCCEKLSYSFNHIRFDIYSSDTDEWETSNITVELPWLTDFKEGVYWNGGIHWIDITNRWECHRFDVEARNLTPVTMPPRGRTIDKSSQGRYFGECNGHLHLVLVDSRLSKILNVFEMDRFSFKWFIKYKVDIGPLISQFPDIYYKGRFLGVTYDGHAFSILCVVRGENEEDEGLVMLIPGKVIFYRFVSKRFQVLSYELSLDIRLDELNLPAYPLVAASLFPLSE